MSRRAFVSAVVLVLGLLTGCAAHPSPSPTPSPRFTSKADAYKAAEDTYRAYINATNHLDLSDPATLENVYRWATGGARDADKKTLTRYHAEGVVVSGQIRLSLVEPRSIDGDLSVVMLNVCNDVSSVEIRASDGTNLVKDTRSPVQSLAVELREDDHSPTGFLVSEVLGRKDGPPC